MMTAPVSYVAVSKHEYNGRKEDAPEHDGKHEQHDVSPPGPRYHCGIQTSSDSTLSNGGRRECN